MVGQLVKCGEMEEHVRKEEAQMVISVGTVRGYGIFCLQLVFHRQWGKIVATYYENT